MGELLIGTTLLASFLGGVVALLAPCCVSVMLPAYLATGFRERGGVLAATLVFGAGVATVILPIGLGATALSRLLLEQHTAVYLVGGTAMILGGVAVLVGWKPNLPMPGARGVGVGEGGANSFRAAYLLGAFSGVASACCAPVLAGVALLSGAAASFPVALAVGLAYVVGMVAPLALIALVWDHRRERASRLLTARPLQLRLGRWQRRLPLGTLLSGLVMIGMGLLAGVIAFTGPGMSPQGWQTRVGAELAHLAATGQAALAWVPGWLVGLLLVAAVALVIRRALRSRSGHPAPSTETAPNGPTPGADDQTAAPSSAPSPADREEIR